MIGIKFQGRMGNQLFQYAFAYHLAKRYKTKIKIADIWHYKTPRNHNFALRHFAIDWSLVGNRHAGFTERVQQKLQKYLPAFLQARPPQVFADENYEEFHEKFIATTYRFRGTPLFDGYWQDERFFKPVEHAIRAQFRVARAPSKDNALLLEKIQAANAVSLHVRRGDYALPEALPSFGFCDLHYYRSAVALMASKTRDPYFFVFSDDIAWAQEHVAVHPRMHFVDINGEAAAHEDLRLMYSCKHHITANSSFSWWGAWLNPSPEKIVIAPTPWFVDPDARKDIVPSSWITLPRNAQKN